MPVAWAPLYAGGVAQSFIHIAVHVNLSIVFPIPILDVLRVVTTCLQQRRDGLLKRVSSRAIVAIPHAASPAREHQTKTSAVQRSEGSSVEDAVEDAHG